MPLFINSQTFLKTFYHLYDQSWSNYDHFCSSSVTALTHLFLAVKPDNDRRKYLTVVKTKDQSQLMRQLKTEDMYRVLQLVGTVLKT